MHNRLPKIFCFINHYNKEYINKLNKNIAIIYRNYNKIIDKDEIIKIKKLCKKTGKKFYLSNNIKTALNLNLDGVYIPSFNRDIKINSYDKKKNFIILGSAHNISEIRTKELQKVEYIFLSPLFITKKSNNFLGIQKFNKIASYTKKKVICLGGIKNNNIKKINLLNIWGFASISLFNKNFKYIKYSNKNNV